MKNLSIMACVFLLTLGACKKASHDHEHGHDHHEGEAHQKEAQAESHDDHHEAPSNVGPNFAVQAVDHHRGIRLSDIAIKTIGIEMSPVTQDGWVDVPHAAIVHDHTLTGIYRWRDNWFTFISIKEDSSSNHKNTQKILSPQFKAGDKIVIAGVALLRIAELDVTTIDVEGHSH